MRRDTLFISKATPADDQFALWLAPRLEAEGYRVFADIISLRAGESWRQQLTDTLRHHAIKMLLCCKDNTLGKSGIQEEIGIATHVMREINDPRFIIPMRLERYAPIFGLANTQFVDFEKSWAIGLDRLLAELERAGVAKTNAARSVSSTWETIRRQLAVLVRNEPERLTSNWIRVTELPDRIGFFEVSGAIDHGQFQRGVKAASYPMVPHHRGVITFLNADEVNGELSSISRFVEKASCGTLDFAKSGIPEIDVEPRDARAHLVAMFTAAWERHATELGLTRHKFSGRRPGFHVGDAHAKVGERILWGRQGDRRSSMLRNVSRGKVWSYGITVIPNLWPFPHLRLKARVMFSDLVNDVPGAVIQSTEQQFRLRRSVCKGWRNKQWHGRLMAFLEVLSGDTAWISLPLGPTCSLRCDSHPLLLASPVTTVLPNTLSDDEEETDPTLLGGLAEDDDEDEPDGEGDVGAS